MEIIIRKQTQKDALACLDIKYKGWLAAYSHIINESAISKHFDEKRKKLMQQLKSKTYIQRKNEFVAEFDGKVVATMALSESLEENNSFEIKYLYVDPACHRNGIGKKLFDFASNIATIIGSKTIFLEALKDNFIGCSFYEKIGGKIISTRKAELCGIISERVTFEFYLKPIILETERLILRNYTLSDLDDYYEYISDETVAGRIGFEPYKSKAEALERLNYEINKPNQFALLLKSENKVIGSIELMPCKTERYQPHESETIEKDAKEIGFMLSPKYWGKGLMPEATAEIMRFAFNSIQVPSIYIGHAEANLQSKRVQDKLGFKVIGTTKNYRTWIDGTLTNFIGRKMTLEEYLINK